MLRGYLKACKDLRTFEEEDDSTISQESSPATAKMAAELKSRDNISSNRLEEAGANIVRAKEPHTVKFDPKMATSPGQKTRTRILKRKNTPATLPTLEKINYKDKVVVDQSLIEEAEPAINDDVSSDLHQVAPRDLESAKGATGGSY